MHGSLAALLTKEGGSRKARQTTNMLESPIYKHASSFSPPQTTAFHEIALLFAILVQADDINDGTHDQVMAKVTPSSSSLRKLAAGNTAMDAESLILTLLNHLDYACIRAGFILWARYWEAKKQHMPGWLTRGMGRFTAFTSCMVLAGKYYQDEIPTNGAFACLAGVDSQDLARIELDVLHTLNYKLLIDAAEHEYWVNILQSYSQSKC